jgi:hypothetical protein
MDFLREHRKGATHDELSDALQELVASVEQEGKAGKLALIITVKPAEKVEGALLVSDEIKLTKPKASKSASVFFVTPENNLVRQDPRQMSMDLHALPPAPVAQSLA